MRMRRGMRESGGWVVLISLGMGLILACGGRAIGTDDDAGSGEGEAGDGEAGDGDGDGDGDGGSGWIYDTSCFNINGLGNGYPCEHSGGGAHGGANEDWCQFCTCDQDCSSDAECASPEGTAKGVCRSGECMLDCGGGATCPAGRECLEWSPGEFECVFATNDEFICEGPWVCGEIQDEADCNANVSDEGYGRCLWVVEDLHDDDSCTPSQTTNGRCVGLLPSDDGCTQADACTGQGPRVYFTDYGAGTFGLWTLDDCDWIPAEGDSQPCDFSQGFGLPLLCDCACE